MVTEADLIIGSRSDLKSPVEAVKPEDEGGCGVVGLASTVPVRGYHILCPVEQMHNRGNGKGGGVAAVGLVPEQMRVPADILKSHYLLQIAYLDEASRHRSHAHGPQRCLISLEQLSHATGRGAPADEFVARFVQAHRRSPWRTSRTTHRSASR